MVQKFAMRPTMMENLPPRPAYGFKPASPVVDKLVAEGKEIEKHYYLHPKLGDTYRYKYDWDGTVWWIDVALDGESLQVWRLDGTTWMEGKAAASAGGDDEDEE